MRYPVSYKATIWEEDVHGERTICGITFADSFADAAKKIESYYSESLIRLSIFLMEECEVIELPKSIVDAIEKGDYE